MPQNQSLDSNGPAALLSTEDVAQMLQKTPWAVCSYVREGKLHAYRLGRSLRFTPEMVKRYLEMHRVR